ncbi:uncharacterized protein LOC117320329 [Pecten maximus]|uniref:uncharacterized protein LOC117320329 n=1 Tax=Pecten maximus TaxID=6579 RepID=UPI001458281F|nr:uncharacterized protein LOC117320329 [Pecten maximus]
MADAGKQAEHLMEALAAMNLKPDLESKDTAAQWLTDLLAGGAKAKVVKREPILDLSQVLQDHRDDTVPSSTHNTSYYVPKISIFSGSPQVPHGEVPFEQWIYEVEMLQRDGIYKDQAIFQAVRRSLRGEAANTARGMGSSVALQQVLDNMTGNYGNIAAAEDLLAKFYSAKQEDSESVTSWASRLEDILDRAKTRCELTQSQVTEMLRTKFWRGLKKSLRDVTGHKFDTIQDYDKLRIAVRQIEQADASPEKPKPVKVAIPHNEDIKEMKALVKDLTTEMSKLKQDLVSLQKNRESGHGCPPARGSYKVPQDYRRQDKPYRGDSDRPVCWRCGQPGHIKRDCRVNLDHSRKSLNARTPTGLGHQ